MGSSASVKKSNDLEHNKGEKMKQANQPNANDGSGVRLRYIFSDDIDELNNTFGNRRGSLLFDIKNTVNFMLQSATTGGQKANVYVMKGDHYFKQALEMAKQSNMDYFRFFRKSLTDYIIANELDPNNVNSSLGIGKCLIKLHKYQLAYEEFAKLESNEKFRKNPEFWTLYGMCSSKQTKIWSIKPSGSQSKKFENFDKAVSLLKMAEELAPSNKEIRSQKEIVANLTELQSKYKKDIYKYASALKENTAIYDVSATRSKSECLYKILSIDGGGYIGLLPAMVLCEIEKRSNSYLPEQFNMFAGSCTGGLLAALCLIPESYETACPLYSMSDILRFYLDNGDILISNPSKDVLLQMYRKKFTDRFGSDLKISEVHNDLIIAATNCDGPLRPDYFSSIDARRIATKDVPLVDAIMATTSTSAKYPAHMVKGFGYFRDGGLTIQNPSQRAYEDAIRSFNKKKEDIYVLSLGTGTYASGIFDDNICFNHKTPSYTFTSQGHSASVFLNGELGGHYKRLEFFCENEMPTDRVSYMNDLIDIGSGYIEDMNDEINQITELLLER